MILFAGFMALIPTIGLSFADSDSDGDNLSDDNEADFRTNPKSADTDNDELNDYQELVITNTNPLNPDTDGDGMSDGNELTLGFDPLDPNSPIKKIMYDTSFDWSMPERFGLDEDNDGLIDYFTTFESVNPPGWEVDFDACSLFQKDRTINNFEWLVEGQSFKTNTCDDFSFIFPYEGVFQVTLITTNPSVSKSYTENVIVQDFLVVSFGDSYASGEGAPDISVNGALVASRIIDLKFQLVNVTNTIEKIENNINQLQNQKEGLEDDLQVLLNKLSEADKADIAKCLALKETIEITQKNIAYLTSKINTEKNKPWYDKSYIKIAFWEARKAINQKLLDESKESFASLDCSDKLQQASEILNQIYEISKDIREIKANIENLIIQKDALKETILDIISNIESLIDLYNQIEPQWEDEDSHRSAKSGHAKAALWLEKADPRTSVTFVHQAVSGSKTTDIKNQVTAANSTIGQREIDAVILSIGGNDARFADIIIKCVSYEPCYEENPEPELLANVCDFANDLKNFDFTAPYIPDKFEEKVTEFIENINKQCNDSFKNVPKDETAEDILFKNLYGYEDESETKICNSFNSTNCNKLLSNYRDNVEDKFNQLTGLVPFGQENPRLERVYHVEYGDSTKDQNGRYCDPQTNPLSPPFISKLEHEWIYTVMETQLNREVQRASEEIGWNYVTGILDESATHGLCSTDPWIVGLEETLIVQKNVKGIAHPNANGYAHYGYAIYEDILSDLYVGGLPRIPDYDKEPPQLTVPSDMIIVSNHPTGLNVNFEVTAVDDFDRDVDISCTPISGSFFSLGNTMVNCIAVDDTGKSDSDSFNVEVVMGSETILGVTGDIESVELLDGTENSMVKKLVASSELFDKGNLKAAQNQLESLLNEISAQNSKKLSKDDSDYLSQLIESLILEIEKLK